MLLPGPPQIDPLNRAGQRGCIKTLKWAVCCNLQAVALKPGSARTRATPPANNLTNSPARAQGRGRLAERGMQAGGPGHIPGETPGLGAKIAQLAPQLRLGAGEANPANSLSFSTPLGVYWLLGGGSAPPRVLVRKPSAPESAAGRGLSAGSRRGGRANHLEKGLSQHCARVGSGTPAN